MPIRVICPSCGRVGRGPDTAVGRTVQCPACLHRHVLTADMAEPDEVPAAAPNPPRKADDRPSRPKSSEQQASHSSDRQPAASAQPRRPVPTPPRESDPYAEIEQLPSRSIRSSSGIEPRLPSGRGEVQTGSGLSTTTLAAGAGGVAVLSILLTWGAIRAFSGSSSAEKPATEVAVRSGAKRDPIAETDVPEQAGTSAETVASSTPAESPAAEEPAPRASEERPAPAPTAVANVPTPSLSPDRETPAASRGDDLGPVLSTADIVAESEASVALIRGNGSTGTGFLIAPGILATNAHVIDDEFIASLEIRFVSADDAHKNPLRAELLYEDRDRDLAFLRVNTDLKPLRIAKTYIFRKGEDITVIGSPGLGDGKVLENAISRGVMSTKTQIDQHNYYQLGIAINPGNSGGPVFDSTGRVIGVATLKSTKQESTGFSIPIEDVQLAMTKQANQSTGEANQYRSKHRVKAAIKSLSGAGAMCCLLIDLRRAYAATNNEQLKELLDKLEPIAAELVSGLQGTLSQQTEAIKNDRLLPPADKNKIKIFAENFTQIGKFYVMPVNEVDVNAFRQSKQAHARLVTELSKTIQWDIPENMMLAFADHDASQPESLAVGPQNIPGLGSRFRFPQNRIPNRSIGPNLREPIGPTIPRPPSMRRPFGPRGRTR